MLILSTAYPRNSKKTVKVYFRHAIPQAQAKVGEPLGFARRPWLESMAVVFAIDGARIPQTAVGRICRSWCYVTLKASG